MSSSDKVRGAFKEIPSVDTILEYFKDQLNSAPYAAYIIAIRSVLDAVRWEIKNGSQISNIPEFTYNKVRIALESVSEINLKQVINGTGIILHTGLGRAPLSKRLVDKALNQILHYSNLEMDLFSGKRGERNSHVELLLTALTGSEASLVVNNNAAAVLLMLNTLAEGKEVIISRGEQVEIGGFSLCLFRLGPQFFRVGLLPVEFWAKRLRPLDGEGFEGCVQLLDGLDHFRESRVYGYAISKLLKDSHDCLVPEAFNDMFDHQRRLVVGKLKMHGRLGGHEGSAQLADRGKFTLEDHCPVAGADTLSPSWVGLAFLVYTDALAQPARHLVFRHGECYGVGKFVP